jgi:hypothetical protein
MYLGNLQNNKPIYFTWDSMSAVGASIAASVAGTIRVYKNSDTTERTADITDTRDFDGVTGLNHVAIVTTDAFYTSDSDYSVVLVGATIDGVGGVNVTIATFSIEKRFASSDVVKMNGALIDGSIPVADRAKIHINHLNIVSDTEDAIYAEALAALKIGLKVRGNVGIEASCNQDDGDGFSALSGPLSGHGILALSNLGDAVRFTGGASAKDISAKEIDSILADTNEIQTALPAGANPDSTKISSKLDILNVQNNTRIRLSVPSPVQIPETGDLVLPICADFQDTNGNPEDPDVNEIAVYLRAINAGVDKDGFLYDDEATTIPATASTTFTPSYWKLLRVSQGRYVTYLKLPFTENPDQWMFTFKLKESTVEFSYCANMQLVETLTTIDLADTVATRQVIAKALKVEDVAGESSVVGSVYEILQNTFDLLGTPDATISDDVRAVAENLLYVLSAAIGDFDSDSTTKETVFKDGLTAAATKFTIKTEKTGDITTRRLLFP